jgi:polyhydroxyalkanoate synthesis regulator phasin
MSQKNVFDTIRARGEEMFGQVAGTLMQNPQFLKAVQRAAEGKTTVDRLVGKALKQMNIPTRSEFKRAVARIDALEAGIADLKAKAAAPRAPRSRKPARRK